jgi:hypothetical protein
METINIYDFLHLLNLIKIRHNMDFGGGIWHLHIYATIHFFFLLFLSKRMEKGSQAKTKVRGMKHNVGFIHFFYSFSFFKLRFN